MSRDIATTAERSREFWRGVLLVGVLFATSSAPCIVGARGPSRAGDGIEHPRPIGFLPISGSTEGGRLIFVDIDEGPAVSGSATVACRFGSHPAIRANYDRLSGRYVCPTPAHVRPEAVTLTMEVGGATVRMPTPFVYVTPSTGSTPPIVVDVPTLAKQIDRVGAELPASTRLCAVLKNGQPTGEFPDIMSRAPRIDYFAVPNLEDGIALRNAGITKHSLLDTSSTLAAVTLRDGREPGSVASTFTNMTPRVDEVPDQRRSRQRDVK